MLQFAVLQFWLSASCAMAVLKTKHASRSLV